MGDLDTGNTNPAQDTKDQSGYEPWIQNVPKALVREDMKGHKSQWDYLQSVWKTRDELSEKLKGYEGHVKPLTKDSTPEEVAAYKKALGIPDRPEDYKLDIEDEEIAKDVREIAAKLYLTPAQAQELARQHVALAEAYEKQRQEQVLKERDATINALKKEWPNDWKEKVQSTNTILRRFFGDEGMQKIAESGLGDAEWFVRGAIEMAKAYREGRIPADGASVDRISLDEEYPSMKGLKSRKW